MTDAPKRLCFVNCGLPGDQCACFRDMMRRAEEAEEVLVRAMPITKAERDVLTERSRQVASEGWDADHDDTHDAGELSVAAACYALMSAGWSRVALWEIWPKGWSANWLKDCDKRRAKVKAAALLIADIERLDRAMGAEELSDRAAIPDQPEVKALVEAAKNAIVAMQEARSVIVSKREHQVLTDAVHAARAALAAFGAKPRNGPREPAVSIVSGDRTPE